MSEIICSLHCDCKAIYVCEHCGFLCNKHIDEESMKRHELHAISKEIRGLYFELATQEQARSYTMLLFQVKKCIEETLINEENNHILLEKFIDESIQKYRTVNMGLNFNTLETIIKESLNSKMINKDEDIKYKVAKICVHFKQFLFDQTKTIQKLTDKGKLDSKADKAPHRFQIEIRNSIIHYWKGSVITVYNPISKRKTKIEFKQIINDYADSISYDSRVFIMGGMAIATVCEVDFQNQFLNNKDSMLIAKFYHSLCSNNRHIYSIGGSTDYSTMVGDCEKYDMVNDKWTLLPTLLTPRNRAAAFIHNNYIYCFCGWSNDCKDLNSMETLSIDDGTTWKYESFQTPLLIRRDAHAIQLNEQQVIVFGGYQRGNIVNDSYLINMNDGSVEFIKNAGLMKASNFCNTSAPVLVDGCIYAVDYTRRIHIYANKKWQLIE